MRAITMRLKPPVYWCRWHRARTPHHAQTRLRVLVHSVIASPARRSGRLQRGPASGRRLRAFPAEVHAVSAERGGEADKLFGSCHAPIMKEVARWAWFALTERQAPAMKLPTTIR